jgi:hypothetical protein
MFCGFCKELSLLESGERGRNRTYNLLIKSQLLCQLSYAPFWGMAIGFKTLAGESQQPTCLLYQTSIVAISTVERCPSTTAIPLSVTW